MHWSVLHNTQSECSDIVTALVLGWGKPAQPYQKARVRFTYLLGTKHRRDGDNLVTATKPLLDALVHCGVIQDDSLEAIGIPDYDWQYWKESLTVIDVWDLTEEI